jgi:hypothetical protein
MILSRVEPSAQKQAGLPSVGEDSWTLNRGVPISPDELRSPSQSSRVFCLCIEAVPTFIRQRSTSRNLNEHTDQGAFHCQDDSRVPHFAAWIVSTSAGSSAESETCRSLISRGLRGSEDFNPKTVQEGLNLNLAPFFRSDILTLQLPRVGVWVLLDSALRGRPYEENCITAFA